VLSFGYGFVSHAWGWFPKSYVERAWDQAQGVWRNKGEKEKAGISMLDRTHNRTGTRIIEPEKMKPGLVLISSLWEKDGEWDPELRLIDKKGNLVHKWRVDREGLLQGGISQRRDPTKTTVHGSHLLQNGDIVANVSYVGMVRFDACGDVVWEVKEGNHHGMAQADDGSFWTPAVSESRKTSTPAYPDGFPGLDTPLWMDQLLHVSENGEVIDRINVLDVLKANGLERLYVKGSRVNPRDPLHLNDVGFLSDSMADEYPLFESGDLLVSLRNPTLVMVFDPETKDVKWWESRYFTYQHDPDFIGDGWIGVFDNRADGTERGAILGGSRIVKIQPHTDSLIVPFPTSHSGHIYTGVRGRWQQLDNGNMLLADYAGGRAIEVTPDGRTVWEFIPEAVSDSTMPGVTKANHVDLTREEVSSWPCSMADSTSATAPEQGGNQ